jgi:hypothetical protein
LKKKANGSADMPEGEWSYQPRELLYAMTLNHLCRDLKQSIFEALLFLLYKIFVRSMHLEGERAGKRIRKPSSS